MCVCVCVCQITACGRCVWYIHRMHAADLSRLNVKARDSCELPCSLRCQELMACEGLRRSFADPVMLNDDRVLQNLLTAEDRCLPNAKYFDFQLEIKPFMRRILTSWMLEVELLRQFSAA